MQIKLAKNKSKKFFCKSAVFRLAQAKCIINTNHNGIA